MAKLRFFIQIELVSLPFSYFFMELPIAIGTVVLFFLAKEVRKSMLLLLQLKK
jgi:hypothetical protein